MKESDNPLAGFGSREILRVLPLTPVNGHSRVSTGNLVPASRPGKTVQGESKCARSRTTAVVKPGRQISQLFSTDKSTPISQIVVAYDQLQTWCSGDHPG
jgi:hypothetical protein